MCHIRNRHATFGTRGDAQRAKTLSAEEKEAFDKKRYLRTEEQEIYGRWNPEEDGDLQEYVKHHMDIRFKEIEEFYVRRVKEWVRERDRKRAWDAYSWDVSMIDPINVLPLNDPVRNKVCDHIYEKAIIEQEIEKSKAENEFMACPGNFDPNLPGSSHGTGS